MKKLSLIIATMTFVFTMQAQKPQGNTKPSNNNQPISISNSGNHQTNDKGVNQNRPSSNSQHNHQGNNSNGRNPQGNIYYGNNQPGNVYNNKPYGYTYPINHGPQVTIYHTQVPPVNYGHNTNYYAPTPMGNAAFQGLMATIDQQNFSSNKMNVFNQAANANYFTSNQVAQLVSLFRYSNDRVKVAKIAYLKTVDPQNYFVVNNQFQYSSSVRELTAYIASV